MTDSFRVQMIEIHWNQVTYIGFRKYPRLFVPNGQNSLKNHHWFYTCVGSWSLGIMLSSWKIFQVLVQHEDVVTACCTSSESEYVISGAADSEILVWDFYTGDVCRRLNGHLTAVTALSATREGNKDITVSGKSMRYFNEHAQWQIVVQKGNEIRIGRHFETGQSKWNRHFHIVERTLHT